MKRIINFYCPLQYEEAKGFPYVVTYATNDGLGERCWFSNTVPLTDSEKRLNPSAREVRTDDPGVLFVFKESKD